MTNLTVTLLQPAQVSTGRRSDNVRETADHLPGWVVRGAFAAAYIRCFGPPTDPHYREDFVSLFEGGVRFPPLFNKDRPYPLSVLTHKYGPRGCQAGDLDLALQPLTLEASLRCADCSEPLKGLRGLPKRPPVDRHTSTQVAARGVAVAETLHSRDSLRSGLSFSGSLIGDSQALELLKEIADEVNVSIGGRRTTKGMVKAQFADSPPGQVGLPLIRDDGLLVLRMESPSVFVNQDGRPQPVPDTDELAGVLRVQHAQVVRHWSRWEHIGGWHAASRLPKPVEIAVAAGSTYLIRTGTRPPDEALAHLLTRGLGLRRHEGFGHVAPEGWMASQRTGLSARAVRLLAEHPDDLTLVVGFLRGGDATAQFKARIEQVSRSSQLGKVLREVVAADPSMALESLGMTDGGLSA
ncbi:MAG: type III-B CRISPR module-associated Cmr3 family protein [Tetrasphaera sp.]